MKRVLIAASGSGGHLFPAVYIAQALNAIESDIAIDFLGSGRPLEASIFAKAGSYPVHTVKIAGVKDLGIVGAVKFLINLPRALFQTWQLLSSLRPDCIVGVGGYVTVLPIILGKLRGVPAWIHEAELKPGLANYVLSFFADKISVAFTETRMPVTKGVVCTGHPVRSGLEVVAATTPRNSPPKNVLIIGGSQGASALDEALPALSELFRSHNVLIRHQCRKNNGDVVRKRYEEQGMHAEVTEFIDDMHEAYRWADIIVSRSGAGSVMEIGIVNKPSILVPFPFSQENHQVENAKLLSDRGKALICEEGPEFRARLQSVFEQVLDLSIYNRMLQAPNPNRNTDAAHRIAEGIWGLTKR